MNPFLIEIRGPAWWTWGSYKFKANPSLGAVYILDFKVNVDLVGGPIHLLTLYIFSAFDQAVIPLSQSEVILGQKGSKEITKIQAFSLSNWRKTVIS